MKLAGGKAVIASNVLIAIAGVGAMLALAYLISIDTTEPKDRGTPSHRPQPMRPAVERLAFAPKDAFAVAPQLRPGFTPESEAEAKPESEVKPETERETAEEDADPSDETASWSTETAASEWRTDLRSRPVVRARPSRQPESDDAPRRRRPYNRSLEKRLAEISPGATARLKKRFEAARMSWPPSEIALIGIKDEKILELHARAKGGPWELIHRYRVLAASGGLGPKLRQGDKQVPEGVYRIAWLNPNSSYHVSLRVSYPNAFDRQMAKKEGRSNLGGDIMIHGKNLSAGCLAIGDEAVEEVFTAAAETGVANVRVIIAPTDLRTKAFPEPKPGQPEWLPKLYTEIASAMSGYEATSPITTSSTNMASSFMSFFAK